MKLVIITVAHVSLSALHGPLTAMPMVVLASMMRMVVTGLALEGITVGVSASLFVVLRMWIVVLAQV